MNSHQWSEAPLAQPSETIRAVPKPQLVVRYSNKDITADITPSLIEMSYTDYLEGQSDSIELAIEDVEQRWQSSWYPEHGDTLNLQIGYQGQTLLPCGDFEIDEIELSGPPDVVHIKGLAAAIKKTLRTRIAQAYEKTTLKEIAQKIAQRNQLTLKGEIAATPISYSAQAYQADLVFLQRLAAEYGYAFSIRGQNLCFFQRTALKQQTALLVLERNLITSYQFQDKVHGIATQGSVSYQDPQEKKLRSMQARDQAGGSNRTSADQLKLNIRAENDQQAQAKADAALERNNAEQTTASMSLFGNVQLMSGVNIQLIGFGKMNGNYHITQARHRFARSSGYTTDIDMQRIRG